jgi:DNA mismatch endonuclease, patch repair protein
MRPNYPQPTSAAATATMKANRRVDTVPEMRVRSTLHARGRRFRKDRPLRVGGRLVRPDIVFGPSKLAVFIDGCFWHGCEEHGTRPRSNAVYWSEKLSRNRRRDAEQTQALEAAGWRVVRIWEHVPPGEACDLIEAELELAGTP